MRSAKDPVEFLKAVAKKKPQLQELIDKVYSMSNDEIEALNQPRWIRDALKRFRVHDEREMYVKARLAQVIAAELEAANLPPATYEVRLWDCDSEFVGAHGISGHQWSIEINQGDSLLIIDDTYIRFGDSTLIVDEAARYNLMLKTKMVGYMTIENYKGFHRALLNNKHKII